MESGTGPAENQVPRAGQPVFLGCLGMAGVVALVVVVGLFLVVFLESGADTGAVRLRVAATYAPGTVEFVGERNFFLVRLGDGTFLALADMDAANRAAEGRRCRVQLAMGGTPGVDELLERYRGRFSAEAAGAQAVFREDCNGAVYDIAGRRLDGAGRNLDQYTVSIDGDRFVVVDVSERTCTTRTEDAAVLGVACGAGE